MQCQVDGCTSRAAAKGKCTTHLGLFLGGEKHARRHELMRKEAHVTRTFTVLPEIPKKRFDYQPLQGDWLDLADQVQAAPPGSVIRVPHDMIDPDFEALSDKKKHDAIKSYANAIANNSAWKRPGGRFKASVRRHLNFGLYVGWEPEGAAQ